MSKKERRKRLLDEVDQTLQTYCNGCFLYSTHKKELGRTYAHQFCLSSCTIGERLKDVGEKMNKI